jgi:hypothetical protein
MNRIQVQCAPAPTGWHCAVSIDDGRGTSAHHVTVATEDATDLAAVADQSDVERLVYETIAFLLEREPKESILSAFDLTVVGRYFPEFEAEIRSRLAP